MTDEDKKLIEAAMLIQEHCDKTGEKEPCIFSEYGMCEGPYKCKIGFGEYFPSSWNIPKPSRWTDADVALAKALMAFCATKITRLLYENSVVYDSKSGVFLCNNCVPYDAFEALNPDETVYLKDIVAEGENNG